MNQKPISSNASQAESKLNVISHTNRISSKADTDKAIADLTAHKQLWADLSCKNAFVYCKNL